MEKTNENENPSASHEYEIHGHGYMTFNDPYVEQLFEDMGLGKLSEDRSFYEPWEPIGGGNNGSNIER